MVETALFYKDAYIKEFDSIVKEVIEEKDKIKVVLDNTAFYPEGGGQPSDTGYMNDVKVIRVEEKNNTIYHIVDKKVDVGQEVKCKIDFDNRFANMQAHSGEHIVSGIICKKFSATNVGFHIGKDVITMDFNVLISEEELRTVEKEANYAVCKNIEIKSTIYSPEDVKNISYRSKKELNENVRIVDIDGYDRCACCGTHVKYTGEIGIIKLLKVEKYKAGVRIYMLVGQKAIDDYTNKYMQINNISTLLSLKLDEVYDGVVNLSKEIEGLKKERSALKNELLNHELENIKMEKAILIEKDNLEMLDMKNFCTKLLKKEPELAGVFSNDKFIIMSDKVDLKDLINNLKKDFDIKGGGNSNLIQGQVNDNIKDIIIKIKSDYND